MGESGGGEDAKWARASVEGERHVRLKKIWNDKLKAKSKACGEKIKMTKQLNLYQEFWGCKYNSLECEGGR